MEEIKVSKNQNDSKIQSNLVITRSSGGIFWDRGISEACCNWNQGDFIIVNQDDCKQCILTDSPSGNILHGSYDRTIHDQYD